MTKESKNYPYAGSRIKNAAQEKGITQKALMEYVSEDGYKNDITNFNSKLAGKHRHLSKSEIEALSDLLNVSTEYVAGNTDIKDGITQAPFSDLRQGVVDHCSCDKNVVRFLMSEGHTIVFYLWDVYGYAERLKSLNKGMHDFKVGLAPYSFFDICIHTTIDLIEGFSIESPYCRFILNDIEKKGVVKKECIIVGVGIDGGEIISYKCFSEMLSYMYRNNTMALPDINLFEGSGVLSIPSDGISILAWINENAPRMEKIFYDGENH